MIYVILTRQHRYTVQKLLDARGGRIDFRLVPMTYQELWKGVMLNPATFIFADLERLSDRGLAWAARIWERMATSGRRVRLLNHPLQAMRRYELLRRLHEQGINDYDVYRVTEERRPTRYPVFLRREHDHKGSLSGLLRSPGGLDRAIRRLRAEGRLIDDLMIVEYCSEPDSRGLYRYYGAYCIDGVVIPQFLMFSRRWMVKRTTVDLDDDLLAQEHAFVRDNPYAEQIRRVFQLARIDYGRIDYNVVDGRFQVYEINTNPNLYSRADERHAEHFPDIGRPSDKLIAALGSIDRQRTARRDKARQA